ncbi:MAG TPA: iron export ABC transporter permease subunit FetB [Terriglobales bacterium]|nr:iron export ABC transporter permease subunit FetB [Terriglobales bacterium]
MGATTGGVTSIGGAELLIASLLMLVAGFASYRMKLGMAKDIVVSMVRLFLQLLALGFVLRWVFGNQTWWLVLLILLVMVASATQIASTRVTKAPGGLKPAMFLSLFVTGLTMAFVVTGLIIRVKPWYGARTVIPIAGMILGNSMSAMAVALDRLFADMDSRTDEILALTALGATAREAAQRSIRNSIRAGLIPTLASMAAAGVVFIPGMMTGQILAGADPLEAAKYQIVVLLMVSASTTACNMLAVLLTYRRRFDVEGFFIEAGMRDPEEGTRRGLKPWFGKRSNSKASR